MPFDDGGCDDDDDAGCDDNDNVCAAGYNGVFDHWDGDVSRKPPITLNAIARTHNPFSEDTQGRAGDDDAGDDDADDWWKMEEEIG